PSRCTLFPYTTLFRSARADRSACSVPMSSAPREGEEAMPLRHSVLWTLRDTTTPEQQVEMLKGLSYLCMECRDVRAGDYGSDLLDRKSTRLNSSHQIT